MCLDLVEQDLCDLIDELSVGDNLGLPQQMTDGKKLGKILLLAAACAMFGLDATQKAREAYDLQKLKCGKPCTRNWFAFVTDQRNSNPILSRIRTKRWSELRE
jgi:hypothetical protein